jgi:hypothetical protein
MWFLKSYHTTQTLPSSRTTNMGIQIHHLLKICGVLRRCIVIHHFQRLYQSWSQTSTCCVLQSRRNPDEWKNKRTNESIHATIIVSRLAWGRYVFVETDYLFHSPNRIHSIPFIFHSIHSFLHSRTRQPAILPQPDWFSLRFSLRFAFSTFLLLVRIGWEFVWRMTIMLVMASG